MRCQGGLACAGPLSIWNKSLICASFGLLNARCFCILIYFFVHLRKIYRLFNFFTKIILRNEKMAYRGQC